MKTAIATITTVAALALAGPAMAAKTTTYKGRTSSGHPITMKVRGGVIRYFVAGVRTSCLPIQGGGYPHTGVDVFGFESTVIRVKRHNRFKLLAKPAFHWREVTQTYDLWLKPRRKGLIGRMRLQYSYMVSTFPIGTFDIYSCLGGARFKVKRVG